MVALMKDLKMIDGNLGHPLAAGRRQHFRGNFASTDEVVGAKEFYLHSRMPESSIKDIEQLTDKGKAELRKYKRFASYWLGLIAFNEGEYEMATNYFDKRILRVKDQGDAWMQGATYNLARTCEQLAAVASEEDAAGFSARARELYLSDTESPQIAGNKLRASRLVDAQASSE